MTPDALMEILNLGLQIIGPIALLLLLWQWVLFLRDNKKVFKWPLKKVKWKHVKERRMALLRWLIGAAIVWGAFALANTFIGMISNGTESGMHLTNYIASSEFSTMGIYSTMFFVASGFFFLLSSALAKFRYLGHAFFWTSFLYVLGLSSSAIFPAGVNVYSFFADIGNAYLGFFGGLFFLLTIIFTVKALLAYDHKQPRKVKLNLEKMLQLCIGLIFLVISTGLMRSMSLGFDAPETMKSFLLDTDAAAYRYSMLLYLFGSFIYLRQVFPYFRYGLMGLLSLSGAYLVFDLINYLV